MKVKVLGQEVEPVSFLFVALAMWVGFTIGTLVTFVAVIAATASAIFNAPARLLKRKGGA